MKHRGGHHEAVRRVLEWLNLVLLPHQWELLARTADWLEDEAIPAGGLGPHEGDRIWSRHLADSLAFACGWRRSKPPSRLLDVGAGVGLPGLPLAILWPQINVTLLDRAGKRIDLAKRAVRSLGLDNVEVRQGDAVSEPSEWDGAVFRAVFPPNRALEVAASVLKPAGIAVIGRRGSELSTPPVARSVGDRAVLSVEVPPTVLDGSVSLLIMGSREH